MNKTRSGEGIFQAEGPIMQIFLSRKDLSMSGSERRPVWLGNRGVMKSDECEKVGSIIRCCLVICAYI